MGIFELTTAAPSVCWARVLLFASRARQRTRHGSWPAEAGTGLLCEDPSKFG